MLLQKKKVVLCEFLGSHVQFSAIFYIAVHGYLFVYYLFCKTKLFSWFFWSAKSHLFLRVTQYHQKALQLQFVLLNLEVQKILPNSTVHRNSIVLSNKYVTYL